MESAVCTGVAVVVKKVEAGDAFYNPVMETSAFLFKDKPGVVVVKNVTFIAVVFPVGERKKGKDRKIRMYQRSPFEKKISESKPKDSQ